MNVLGVLALAFMLLVIAGVLIPHSSSKPESVQDDNQPTQSPSNNDAPRTCGGYWIDTPVQPSTTYQNWVEQRNKLPWLNTYTHQASVSSDNTGSFDNTHVGESSGATLADDNSTIINDVNNWLRDERAGRDWDEDIDNA